MALERCPYLFFGVGAAAGDAPRRRVALYDCSLTQVMRSRLEKIPPIPLPPGTERATADPEGRLLRGPDLEPVSTATCTERRCAASCKPTFAQILADHGVDATLPPPRAEARVRKP